MSVITVTKSNFESEIKNNPKRVLIDFWASWCGPCMHVSPLVDEVADEHPEFAVGKVNVDDDPELAREFGIVSIPTLVVMEGGKVLRQSVGAVSKDKIVSFLKG